MGQPMIRREKPGDFGEIRSLHQDAFGRPEDGRLVDKLRETDGLLLSLVATVNDHVVGHILYSTVLIGPGKQEIVGAALGPMAVQIRFRRQGIGGRLIENGNLRLRENRIPFVVVLGHPQYYPRFGFTPAVKYGIRCRWDVPEDVFLIRIFDEARMKHVSGLVEYHPEFSNLA